MLEKLLQSLLVIGGQALPMLDNAYPVMNVREKKLTDSIKEALEALQRFPTLDELGAFGAEIDEQWLGPVIEIDSLKIIWEQRLQLAKMRHVLISGAEMIDKGETDPSSLIESLRDVVRSSGKELPLSLAIDYQRVIAAQKKIREEMFSTGLSGIDKALGGLGRGELSITMALPGGGKSSFLVWLAYYFITQGLNVLVVTLELSKESWAARLLKCVARVDTVGLFQEDTLDKLNKFFKVYYDAQCFVHYERAQSCSVSDLEALIDLTEIINGVKFDTVVVDYLDEMSLKGIQTFDKEHSALKGLTTSLRGIAVTKNIHIATATQANSGAIGKRKMTQKNTSNSFGKVAVTDILGALCQTEEEAKKSELRYVVLKNRERGGVGREVPLHVDQNRMQWNDAIQVVGQEDVVDTKGEISKAAAGLEDVKI